MTQELNEARDRKIDRWVRAQYTLEGLTAREVERAIAQLAQPIGRCSRCGCLLRRIDYAFVDRSRPVGLHTRLPGIACPWCGVTLLPWWANPDTDSWQVQWLEPYPATKGGDKVAGLVGQQGEEGADEEPEQAGGPVLLGGEEISDIAEAAQDARQLEVTIEFIGALSDGKAENTRPWSHLYISATGENGQSSCIEIYDMPIATLRIGPQSHANKVGGVVDLDDERAGVKRATQANDLEQAGALGGREVIELGHGNTSGAMITGAGDERKAASDDG